MANLWPWMAIAGLGAFHGLSPANGWMFAAAWGVREGGGAQVRRALLPIAIGHAASVAVVAGAVALGMSMDHTLAQGLAGALLVGVASTRLLRGAGRHAPIGRRTGHAGMALWSFLMATAHGAGLMLVPALVPLCLGEGPAREITASGSLVMALAAVGVHTAAMLITTGLIATGVCRGVAMHPRLMSTPKPAASRQAPRRGQGNLGAARRFLESGAAPRHAWTAALAVTGVLLMALR